MTKPEFIYRYFSSKEFCDEFLFRGKVLFRPRSYFLACEDESRRDSTEASNIFAPEDGLKITKLNYNENLTLDIQLISSIPNPDQVFIYCSSTQFSAALFERFNAVYCIKINRKKFECRVKEHLQKNFKYKFVYAGKAIDYYDPALPPDTRHADPERIVFSKPKHFEIESEFRFTFSQNPDAFNVNNVSCVLTNNHSRPTSNIPGNDFFLEIGNVERCCTKLSVTDLYQ
jgi:hypothetical protein